MDDLDDLEEELDEFEFDDVEDQLAADAILAVEPVAAPVEVEQERYRRFIQLLQNFGVDKNRENQSLEIDVIRSLFANMEKNKPFHNAEIDACIDQMADENKVIRRNK